MMRASTSPSLVDVLQFDPKDAPTTCRWTFVSATCSSTARFLASVWQRPDALRLRLGGREPGMGAGISFSTSTAVLVPRFSRSACPASWTWAHSSGASVPRWAWSRSPGIGRTRKSSSSPFRFRLRRTLVTILVVSTCCSPLSRGMTASSTSPASAAILLKYRRRAELIALRRRRGAAAARGRARRLGVQSGASEPEVRTDAGTPRRVDADPVAAEVDRVLDKISQQGIAQPHARRAAFLDEVSKQNNAAFTESNEFAQIREFFDFPLASRGEVVSSRVLINLTPGFLRGPRGAEPRVGLPAVPRCPATDPRCLLAKLCARSR